jgi:5-formyltetrahydrofolate cyclo-ligase
MPGTRRRVHNARMSQEAGAAAVNDKTALRRELRAGRRSLAPQRDRGADGASIAAAASSLLDALRPSPGRTGEHSSYDERTCVAIYRSLPLEPPTEALAAMLHGRGIRVIVPETLPDFDLEWRELRPDGSEGPRLGPAGVADARVIFAPALAVDHTGARLGQGGGCYDRALPRRRPDALIVAIVNDQEYAARGLPCDPHDVLMNAVITPGGGYTPIAGARADAGSPPTPGSVS